MNIDKTVIDFSSFSDYQVFSDGYYWMTYKETISVNDIVDKNTLEDSLNSPLLWDIIGRSLFGMPYIFSGNEYQFVIPVYSDSLEKDVLLQEKIGDIIKTLTKQDKLEIYFSDKSKIILYNDKIVVENIFNEDDVNITNIVYNVITLFLLQTLRRGQ